MISRHNNPCITENRPLSILISYARNDEKYREILEAHLIQLERQNVITVWHDRMIPFGTEWEVAIESKLEEADIILLLISASFLSSDSCYEELNRSMELHEEARTRVIPIIISPCCWQDSPIGRLHALPRDGRAITTWSNQNRAYVSIYKGIRTTCLELLKYNTHEIRTIGSDISRRYHRLYQYKFISWVTRIAIIFSLAFTGIILATMVDFEYELTKIFKKDSYFVSTPYAIDDPRQFFFYDLLRIILGESTSDYKIHLKQRVVNGSQSEITSALNLKQFSPDNRKRSKIDIAWMMRNEDRDSLASGIKFPVTLGLYAHRLCLVDIENKIFQDSITKSKLKEAIKITQVRTWPDFNIFEAQGFKTIGTNKYKDSLDLLSNGKVDCFARSVNEIYIEKENLNQRRKRFSIANNVFFKYISPINFYVRKDNKKLKNRINEGLIEAVNSGKYRCIFEHHYSHQIKQAKLNSENEILIGKDADSSLEYYPYYLDFTKPYKDIFKGINKMEEAECETLIRLLENHTR